MTNSNGIILLLTGPISTVSSIIIIVMVLRSNVKLANTYHRLMFGISVTDIILSCGLSFSSLPAPIGTPDTWKALGTRSTCNAQGFLIMLGSSAAPFYFLSLQIYYLCRIKYQTSSENMRKVEPFLHGVPILVGLVSAFVALVTDSMNPGTRGYCWLQDFPLHCTTDQDVECIRGTTGYTQRTFLIVLPFFVNTILIGITMWMIYTSVKKRDSRDALHNFEASVMHNDGVQRQSTSRSPRRGSFIRSPEEILKSQYTKSRKARQRIMDYFVAYVLAYIFPVVDLILHKVLCINTLLEILVMIFYPLWGFFNLVVFIRPAVKKVQGRDAAISLPRACVTAIISYVGPGRVDSRALRKARVVSIAARTLHYTKSTEESIGTF